MKIKRTFTAEIAVGFREGYSKNIHTIEEALAICKKYCNLVGLCVTVTPTQFIYSSVPETPDGFEPGCLVRLIKYPRFPASPWDITGNALELAKIFILEFNQNRISVITSDQTYLVEKEDTVGFKTAYPLKTI
jgi:hypothetical protein